MLRGCLFILLGLLCLPLWAASPVRLGVSLPIGDAKTLEARLNTAQTAGIQLVSLRAEWPRVQPAAGKWDFTALDAAVHAVRVRKLEVMLVFGPTPTWAVKYLDDPTPEQAARALPDLPAWQSYVTAVAKRYADRITYYQLWERPAGNRLLAMPKDIHAHFRAAARAVHAVQPTLKVVAAEPGDINLDWLKTYLHEAPAMERPDVLLLHPATFALTPANFVLRLQTLREHVLPRTAAPALWAELPLPAGQPGAWMLPAVALQQDLSTLFFALPATADAAQQAGLATLARVQGYQHAGYLNLTSTEKSPVECALFRATDKPDLALFTSLGNAQLPLARATTASEPGLAVAETPLEVQPLLNPPAGIPVGEQTVLLLPPGPSLVRGVRCTARPGTPPATVTPVEGDTISLDLTGTQANAVHANADYPGGHFETNTFGELTALCTVTDTAPWIHLELPPGFLFYNHAGVPVDVTIQVLGASQPEKCGFCFNYDAVGGLAYTPWQWIEVGSDKRFTYTIHLTDALFSSRDGYDLRLEMGGSTESVRLVGLTVKKGK